MGLCTELGFEMLACYRYGALQRPTLDIIQKLASDPAQWAIKHLSQCHWPPALGMAHGLLAQTPIMFEQI